MKTLYRRFLDLGVAFGDSQVVTFLALVIIAATSLSRGGRGTAWNQREAIVVLLTLLVALLWTIDWRLRTFVRLLGEEIDRQDAEQKPVQP